MLLNLSRFFTTIILILASNLVIAQGFVIQGVARNAGHAALSDKLLSFSFSVQSSNGSTTYYSEAKSIQTDTYGVFSHVIGQGDNKSGDIADVPYGHGNLKLVVSVTNDGQTNIISDQPFNYVPYAYQAANGAPAGSIMPYVGASAPAGWILCDGSSVPNGTVLKDVLGVDNAPDLRGIFLRGTGTSSAYKNSSDEFLTGPNLNNYEKDQVRNHNHSVGTYVLSNAGAHSHSYYKYTGGAHSKVNVDVGGYGYGSDSYQTDTQGDHAHNMSGNSGNPTANSGSENKPASYGVTYIIKL
ncbi:tail fiber protein [Flammeovirga pectinis]|uniref:Tail fiber protein n=1 Tax=Flammeovirga pectinis TaxID=2494373 RepID=A0A3Q9FQM0_9BACT|nr:tail fiber protein [Flammeovirga pectinis]AZQ63763.1 tail fiber protein [Flammeovirga pectinis]